MTAIYGLLAWALLAGCAAGLLPVRRLTGRQRWLLAVGAGSLALLPVFAGESLAMGLHGAFAAPSLTLVQLALGRLTGYRPPSPGRTATWAFILFGAGFYALALGVGPFDPYTLGYRPLPLLAALLLVAGWLVRRRANSWLLILGVDLFGYALGLFANLWDALFDPLLVLAAAVRAGASFIHFEIRIVHAAKERKGDTS